MLAIRLHGLCIVLVALFACVGRPVPAQSLQLVSKVKPELALLEKAGLPGVPLISLDGRHVLFASTNNLLLTPGNDRCRVGSRPVSTCFSATVP